MPYGPQEIVYCLHACTTNYHRIIGHPPIAVEPSNNQWLVDLSESPEVQLFPANCKLLISCGALGAGEERWQTEVQRKLLRTICAGLLLSTVILY